MDPHYSLGANGKRASDIDTSSLHHTVQQTALHNTCTISPTVPGRHGRTVRNGWPCTARHVRNVFNGTAQLVTQHLVLITTPRQPDCMSVATCSWAGVAHIPYSAAYSAHHHQGCHKNVNRIKGIIRDEKFSTLVYIQGGARHLSKSGNSASMQYCKKMITVCLCCWQRTSTACTCTCTRTR